MNKIQQWSEKWNQLTEKARPGLNKANQICGKTGTVLGIAGQWAWRLRKFVIAVPVVWLAIYLARLNLNTLPEMVGLNLQVTGEYARMVTREAAVYGPLAVTAVCLLLMFISRKTLFLWVVAMFSLSLPLLILVTNIFPA